MASVRDTAAGVTYAEIPAGAQLEFQLASVVSRWLPVISEGENGPDAVGFRDLLLQYCAALLSLAVEASARLAFLLDSGLVCFAG